MISPTWLDHREPTHPATIAAARERRELCAEEAGEVLADAYRPLVTYLHAFQDYSSDEDAEEWRRGLRGGISLAQEAARTAWELHRNGVKDDCPFDWITGADLLVVATYAIDGLTRDHGKSLDELGPATSAIEGLVRAFYIDLRAQRAAAGENEGECHVASLTPDNAVVAGGSITP